MQPPDRPRPELRASDSDREHTAAWLHESYSEGRLTLDEFQERLQHAYAAKTHGELAILTADLPVQSAPLPPPAPPTPVPRDAYWRQFRQIVMRFVLWSLFWIGIWAVTGRDASFWPIWLILIMGFFAASRILGIETRERRRMDKAERRRQRQEEQMRRRGR
jgi:hypothetical protein